MSEKPPVNPNVDDIADQAKYGFYKATQLLAATQYRLGELAGTGRLDPDESMNLQENLVHIWENLYYGTLCAVRDEDTDDDTLDEAENTYSDGRQIRIKIRVEPAEESDCAWEHNKFLLGDGAVDEHPLGTICHISPVSPADEIIADPPRPTDFDALRRRLQQGGFDDGDEADPIESDRE